MYVHMYLQSLFIYICDIYIYILHIRFFAGFSPQTPLQAWLKSGNRIQIPFTWGVPHLGSIPIRVLAAELQPWLSLQPSPRHSWPIRFQWPNVPIIFTITQHKRGVPHGRQHMPIVKKGQVLVFASIWKLQDLHKSHGRSISSTTRNSIYFDILSWFSP